MSNKISDLRPNVAKMAADAGHKLDEKGVRYCDTSTLRTDDEQIALHAQGRAPLEEVNRLRAIAHMRPIPERENRYTVTNCDGVKTKSRHQGGTAIDRVPADEKGNPIWPLLSDPRWKQIADVMKEYGFTWGGDWTKEKDGIDPDYPHYEVAEIKGA